MHVTGKVAEWRGNVHGSTYSLRRTRQREGWPRPRCAGGHTERGRGTPHFLMTDWRVTMGAQLGRLALVLVCLAAGLAVVLSAVSLWRESRRRGSRQRETAETATASPAATQTSTSAGRPSCAPTVTRQSVRTE